MPEKFAGEIDLPEGDLRECAVRELILVKAGRYALRRDVALDVDAKMIRFARGGLEVKLLVAQRSSQLLRRWPGRTATRAPQAGRRLVSRASAPLPDRRLHAPIRADRRRWRTHPRSARLRRRRARRCATRRRSSRHRVLRLRAGPRWFRAPLRPPDGRPQAVVRGR